MNVAGDDGFSVALCDEHADPAAEFHERGGWTLLEWGDLWPDATCGWENEWADYWDEDKVRARLEGWLDLEPELRDRALAGDREALLDLLAKR